MGDEQQTASFEQSAEAARELVARVVGARIFRRSARQRELLEYLAGQAFAMPPRETHEQDIGVAVFGRPPEYDTSQDNIVRVHVSELRKKLEEYFRTEGQTETHVLEIPRGGYSLLVHARPAVPTAAIDLPPVGRPANLRTVARILAATSAVLAGLCVYLGVRDFQRSGPVAVPTVQANQLWRQFFDNNRETDLIVADSCISLFTDIVDAPVNLQDYINRTYLLGDIANQKDAERRRTLQFLMSRRYTSMADVLTVQRITSLSALDHKSVSIYFARDYPSQRLRSMNVILLGSKRSNPWVEAFEEKMNFRMEYDAATGDNRVLNLHPKAGETASFMVPGRTIDPSESLAIIAYLPSSEGNGAALILAGTGLQGTTAAGEAFVSPKFQKVADALPKTPSGRLPYFEALLNTHAIGSTVQSFSVLATRVLDSATPKLPHTAL